MDTSSSLLSAKRDFGRLGFGLFTMAICSLALQLLMSLAVSLLAPSGALAENTPLSAFLNFLPLYGIALPIGFLVLRRAPAESCAPAKLRAKDYWALFLICFPLMYGGSILGSAISLIFSGGTSSNPVDAAISDLNWMQILITVVGAPVLEEFFFRKQLIDRSARYGEGSAILFSALMFGLFHMNLYQFFYAFLIGLVFGYVYLRTRCLRYSILMHMSINTFGGVIPALLSEHLGEDALELADSADGLSALGDAMPAYLLTSLYSLLALALCVTGIIILIKKCRRFVLLPASEELPRGMRFRTIYCRAGVILFTVVCVLVGTLILAFY